MKIKVGNFWVYIKFLIIKCWRERSEGFALVTSIL